MSNYTTITEEFNNLFAKIGKTVSEPVPSPIASFHSHLNDRSAVNFSMQPTDINEIKNVVRNLKTKCRAARFLVTRATADPVWSFVQLYL